jgi:hypothetical protein
MCNLYKFQYTFDNLKYDYFKIDGLKSNLYLQYVVSQNNFQDKFVIGWNDLMYYKLVGVKELGFQTATGFGIQ